MCQALLISSEYRNFGVAVDGSSSDECTGITTGSRDMVLLGRGGEIGERELVPISSVSGEQSILSTRDFVFPVRIPPPHVRTYVGICVRASCTVFIHINFTPAVNLDCCAQSHPHRRC